MDSGDWPSAIMLNFSSDYETVEGNILIDFNTRITDNKEILKFMKFCKSKINAAIEECNQKILKEKKETK